MSIKTLILIATAMFAAHSLGLVFFDPSQGISGLWPASGVAVAALLLSPRRALGPVLGTVFGISWLANLFFRLPPWVSLGFATANVVECWLAVAVVRGASADWSFFGVRDTLALVRGAAVGVIVSGVIGASATSWAWSSAFAVAYRTWIIADFLGILLVVPLAVGWLRPGAAYSRAWQHLELVAFSLAWIGAAAATFLHPRVPGGWNVDPYMLLPLLAWAALRFGLRVVSTALAVLAGMAVIGSTERIGAFGAGGAGATEHLLVAQLYLGITALSGLLLAATQAERRAATLEAHEGQARLRALGDNIPDGMVYQLVREPDGQMRFLYVSRGVERIHGVAVNAVLQDASLLYNQFIPVDRLLVTEAEQVSRQTLQPFRALARIRNTNGEIRSVVLSSSPRRLSDGRTLWDGVETDLTELRRAEDKSLRAAERLKMALDAVHMGTWEWDIATGNVFWSDNVERIFGLDPGAFGGTYASYLDLMHPEDRAWAVQLLERVLRGDSDEFELEHRIVTRDGAPRWLAGKGRVYRDASARALRVAGTVVDVTARKAAQDAVRLSDARLRQAQKLEALGTLAGGIAHDFNNILGAIMAHAELVRMERVGDATLHDHVEEILTASNRAASLVKKILSFSRKQGQQRARTMLDEVIAEALSLLRATLPATIVIEEDVDRTLPAVFADPTQLLQVIMNLCTNAAHAMNNRGKLGLRVERCGVSADSRVPNAELSPGQYARITVTDTGYGMDQETIGRIFDPFFTTKEPGAGTGLGLAVAFGIVKDHEGAIRVTSQPDEGTTFTVYLPLMETETVVQRPSDEVPARGHGELILFVDDERVLCDVGSNLLTRAGYSAQTCRSSSEAWAVLEKDPARFAAVVTDLTMPGMTGIELASRISKLQPKLPVVVATGFLDGDSAAAIARLHVHQVLSKPYGYGALTSAVASAIESRRA